MKRLFLDYSKCIGCRLCELTCSAERAGVYNPKKSRIRSYRIGIPEQIVISYCRHCDEAVCMESCPVNAIEKDTDGAVIINVEKCIGCENCVDSCPAQAIFMNHNEGTIPIKCDLCHGNPKCVDVCPRDALKYGEYAAGELLPPDKILEKLLKNYGLSLQEFQASFEE